MYSKQKNRLLFLLIAFISVVPMIAAWWLHSHPQRQVSRSNYGHLVDPAVRLLPQGLTTANPALPGRWVLAVATAPDGCDGHCATAWEQLAQVHLLLNKDYVRVQRVIIASGPDPVRISVDQGAGVIHLTPTALQAVAGIHSDKIRSGSVLLFDPLGNWVMWYDTGFDPFGLMKDLKHLLKLSQIG